MSNLELKLLGLSQEGAMYKLSWKGFTPRSATFPQLLRFNVEACDENVQCVRAQVLERYFTMVLNISEYYDMHVDAIYELEPTQRTRLRATRRFLARGSRPVPTFILLLILI